MVNAVDRKRLVYAGFSVGEADNFALLRQLLDPDSPDGDKEKQLMQGLLNQRDMVEEAGREKRLF